uniref:G protein-coupled receptor n=2 Tax=Bursaphelenchus xylophilus TaxID=6326 RepID=A0A1I7SIR7_BURXY
MRWNPQTEVVPHPITNMIFAILNCSVCAFGVIGTTVIFGLIYYKRHYGEAKSLPRRLEYRILIQNTFIFACAVTSMFTGEILPFVNETIRTNVLNVILICASPYLYLTLNRDIRRSFIGIFSKQYAESMTNSRRVTDQNLRTITLNTSTNTGRVGPPMVLVKG